MRRTGKAMALPAIGTVVAATAKGVREASLFAAGATHSAPPLHSATWLTVTRQRTTRRYEKPRASFTAAAPRCVTCAHKPPALPKMAPWHRHSGRHDIKE